MQSHPNVHSELALTQEVTSIILLRHLRWALIGEAFYWNTDWFSSLIYYQMPNFDDK